MPLKASIKQCGRMTNRRASPHAVSRQAAWLHSREKQQQQQQLKRFRTLLVLALLYAGSSLVGDNIGTRQPQRRTEQRT